MSEETIVKNFVLVKTTPNDVLFRLHPIDNPSLTKKIHLTKAAPKVALPINWALGVFFSEEVYNMYRKGLFTFNDNEAIVKLAVEQGVYFDDTLDFIPAKPDDGKVIEDTLMKGNRANILNCIKTYGEDRVKEVAIAKVNTLPLTIVKMLENIFKVQLVMEEDYSTDQE